MSDASPGLVRASDASSHDEAQTRSKIDTSCDALLNTVKSTCDPVKESFSSKGSTLHHINEAVNALASLQSAPSQLLNTGIARIPLLDKMPGMPAAVISAAHLGTPHAHDHPPSDGFPLPSVGATIGSGCLSVLIGGMPAARVTDMGIAPTCGGLTPYFDIETGSSNTFIGGMRAARMGVDMTRHCNPMGHAGKSGEEAEGAAKEGEEVASEAAAVSSGASWMARAGKAWKIGNAAVGPASGVAAAASDAKHDEVLAAAMMAAQTAADAAMMVLGNLMGKDPGIEPSMGVLLDGDPTVLIGGFPMPDSQMMWHGVKHGIGKKVTPKLPKWAQKLACEFRGEPISAVSGEVRNDFTDYATDEVVPFKWGRHYSSGCNDIDGALGYGFRHAWQRELRLLRTRAIYVDPRGTEFEFRRLDDGRYGGYCQGYVLEQHSGRLFVVRHDGEGRTDFERADETDPAPRCVSHANDDSRSVVYWHAHGRMRCIAQSDSSGQVRRMIAFEYDQRGRIVEVARTEVDGQATVIARYAYDERGCLRAHRDALDAASAFEYDVHRRMVRLTDANGYAFSYAYDSEGRCVESTGQDGKWHVTFQYQPGRTMVTEGDGGRWTVLYNDVGTITRVIDPYGGIAEYVLGTDGRIVDEIDSGGRSMRWLYDENDRNTGRMDRWGNVWPVKDSAPALPNPHAHKIPGAPLELQWGDVKQALTTDAILLPPVMTKLAATIFDREIPTRARSTQCDAAGRVIARADEYGAVERFLHDAAGNVVQRCDRDGREYRYGTASWNLCESETDPLGGTIAYRHTVQRSVAAIIDANGNESAYTYDYKNRLTSVIRHGVVRESYRYDLGDRLLEKRDSAGDLMLRFEIGENGLCSKRILSSGDTHAYDYDARGNFTRASTDQYEITRAYDADNHLIEDLRDGLGVQHAFLAGRLASTTYFGRFVVRYESEEDGVRIHTPAGGAHRFQRDPDGRLLLSLGNGTHLLSGFDAQGRCSGRITWFCDRLDDFRTVQYRYSAMGELRCVIDSATGVTQYQYDAAHRLVGETCNGWPARRFEYDRGGNLLSSPELPWVRYTEGNRIAAASSGTYCYDRRNHLAEEWCGDRRTTYRYDSMDLLVRVDWSDRPGASWTARYDGLCRRLYQAVGATRTDYFWDRDRLAAEMSSDGRLRLYVYVNEAALAPFMFIDYASIDAEPECGRAYFVFHNQVGVPEFIEDEQGAIVWSAQSIAPYGEIVVAQGSAIEYNLRFPGHYFDEATGLHYNRFRSYHPRLARYLQSDPAGQFGGINLYAYVANPLVAVDVLGLHETSTGRTPSWLIDATEAGSEIEKQIDKFWETRTPSEPLSVEDSKRIDALYERLDKVKIRDPFCGRVDSYKNAPSPRTIKHSSLDDKQAPPIAVGWNPDHVPSGGALRQRAKNVLMERGIWGDKDFGWRGQFDILRDVYNHAMTIMTRNPVHADGRTYGNKNKPLIKGDADDLGGSFKKDTAAISERLQAPDALGRIEHPSCLRAYTRAVYELSSHDFNAYVDKQIIGNERVRNVVAKRMSIDKETAGKMTDQEWSDIWTKFVAQDRE